MTAILGTLPFLATLWLLMVVGAGVLEESGDKIAAALRGEAKRIPTAASSSVRLRQRGDERRPRCARAPLRAAA